MANIKINTEMFEVMLINRKGDIISKELKFSLEAANAFNFGVALDCLKQARQECICIIDLCEYSHYEIVRAFGSAYKKVLESIESLMAGLEKH